MSYLLSPGDLVITVGDEWQPGWLGVVGIVLTRYEEHDRSDEPRWRVITPQGDIVVFREEVDVINDANGENHEESNTCGW